MRSFDELVTAAMAADVTGWSFDWLAGRATEQRPPWGYARLLSGRLATADSALDLDTGGGEVMAEALTAAATRPARMCVTEGWAPNAARARDLLGAFGVEVVDVSADTSLPFPDHSFELVTARHPVRPCWPEIARVLADGGTYFAQHVGPSSAFELIEFFLGPLPRERKARDPQVEIEAAQHAGLSLIELRTACLRMEFFDVGAVVWTLRKCPWWVPDFTPARYHEQLRALDSMMRAGDAFVAQSTRHLLDLGR